MTRRILSLALALMLCVALLGACGGGNSATSQKPSATPTSTAANETTAADTQTDEAPVEEAKSLSGEITFLSRFSADIQNALISSFEAKYPGTKITPVEWDGDLQEFITTMAASNNLPDVFEHWHLATFASNGWLAPLDDLMTGEKVYDEVIPMAMEASRYYGKQYALPNKTQYVHLFVNLDLLDTLNIKMPKYDWTVEEFEELLKKTTTDKYGGINHVWGMEYDLTAVIDPQGGWLTYNSKDKKFDFTRQSWIDAVNYVKNWKAAGYVADDLAAMPASKEGFENAYEEKFGVGVPAIDSGFVALGYIGTWDWNSWVSPLPFEMDFLPLPRFGDKVHLPLQTDYISVSASSDNKDLAYEFAKWCSVEPEGMSTLFNKIAELPLEEQKLLYPSTTNAQVVEAFKSVESYPQGAVWMLENSKDAFQDDPQKNIPNWGHIMWDVIYPIQETMTAGGVNALDVSVELTTKANEALDEEFKKMNDVMKAIQDEYDAKNKK